MASRAGQCSCLRICPRAGDWQHVACQPGITRLRRLKIAPLTDRPENDLLDQARAACGFACVRCGATVYEYCTALPTTAPEGDSPALTLLCPSCREVVSNLLGDSPAVAAILAHPIARQAEFDRSRLPFVAGKGLPRVDVLAAVEMRYVPVPILFGGYPVIDVSVEIIDGSYHDVDSNEMAFKMAAIFAVKDGFKKAKPILLEPIMKVENTTPDEFQGDIMGDLNRRRGKIMGIDNKLGLSIVNAEVPLAEMFGYSTAIRSLSKGRSSYSMEPSHFEQVPAQVLAAIVDQKGQH